jgi:hypothetical protein
MGVIFLMSFMVLFINIVSNQIIIHKSDSLLKDNYQSVKCAVNMLKIIDEMNNMILLNKYIVLESNQPESNENKYGFLKEAFEQQLEQQNNNVTEPGEQQTSISD